MEKEVHVKNSLNLNDIYYDKEGYPMFGYGSLKEPIVCIRPGHKSGLPQVYVEEKNGKIISHNYGHSGVGWTLLFGCVEKAIENFQKLRLEKGISFNSEITVVGLGCMGLVTALTLYFRGFTKIKIIGERFMNTPSHGAGGLIEFSLSTIYKQDQFDLVNEYFKITFAEYQQILQGKHKFIKYGVREVDYYTDYYQENAGLSYLANIGLIPKPKKVILKLGDAPERELFHFKTFNISTSKFMNSLLYTIQKLKIPVEFKKISTFDEISSNLIFNCTGIGSKFLNNDKDCYPICGHGVILSDEAIADHGYILRLGLVPELKDHDIDGALYFMPKSSGFIGGTYMKNYDGSDEKLNMECIRKLLERSKFVFNGIKPILTPKF
jgi:hypothetical protein